MAQVDFTLEEFATFAHGWIGEPEDFDTDLRAIYDLMLEARNYRTAMEALRTANEFLEGMDLQGLFERDGQVVTDPWDAQHLIEYINAGDTYAETLIYDVQRRTFYLSTYGDFVEGWEAENPREDICGECSAYVPAAELEETGICNACRNKPVPTWIPRDGDPLIAMLRSAEGYALAVHAIDDDPTNLAFSVPTNTAGEFYAEKKDEPYAMTLMELIERFEHNDDTLVTFIGEQNVVITRDQYSRLRVALDSFTEYGGKQIKAFLTTPPVLWRCSELTVDWYEERGEAIVRVFTGQETEHVREGNQPLEVWSARSPEVEQLIEDGFIKWKNDRSLLEYLGDHGVCRR